MKDYYVILGISYNATEDEIKDAYRKLIKENHPDKFINDPTARALAEEKMKDIIEAHKYVIAHLNDSKNTRKKVYHNNDYSCENNNCGYGDNEEDNNHEYENNDSEEDNDYENNDSEEDNNYENNDSEEDNDYENTIKYGKKKVINNINDFNKLFGDCNVKEDNHHSREYYYNNVNIGDDDENIDINEDDINGEDDTEFIRRYKNNDVHSDYEDYSEDGILQDSCHIEDKHHMIIKIYYYNGQIKSQAYYKDNKLDGECKHWYKNGQIKSQSYYKNGKIYGEYRLWYRNGQMKLHVYYKNGVLDGEYKEWYENGQLLLSCKYKNGEYDGELISYFDNGNIFIHELYKDGIKIKNIRDYWFLNIFKNIHFHKIDNKIKKA